MLRIGQDRERFVFLRSDLSHIFASWFHAAKAAGIQRSTLFCMLIAIQNLSHWIKRTQWLLGKILETSNLLSINLVDENNKVKRNACRGLRMFYVAMSFLFSESRYPGENINGLTAPRHDQDKRNNPSFPFSVFSITNANEFVVVFRIFFTSSDMPPCPQNVLVTSRKLHRSHERGWSASLLWRTFSLPADVLL